jgi:hypothetical protein
MDSYSAEKINKGLVVIAQSIDGLTKVMQSMTLGLGTGNAATNMGGVEAIGPMVNKEGLDNLSSAVSTI